MLLTYNVKNLNKRCSFFQHIVFGLCDVCCCCCRCRRRCCCCRCRCEYFRRHFLDYAEEELKSNKLCVTGINNPIAWNLCGKNSLCYPITLNLSPEILNKCPRMSLTQWCSYLSTVGGQIRAPLCKVDR